MPRVKRGTIKNKARKKTLSQAKGYRFGRSNKKRQATEAIAHAGNHAFAHRKDKKSNFRRLWNVKINAAVRNLGMSYSTFMGAMRKNNIEVNRKMLAHLAEHNPESFERIVKKVS